MKKLNPEDRVYSAFSSHGSYQRGDDLQTHIATQLMAGILANPRSVESRELDYKHAAKSAVKAANALIDALNKDRE